MSAPGLPYAWYGDDFTGAADTLATVASAGLRAGLFLGVPSAAQRERLGPLDALGIAGTARALNPTAMRSEIAPVGDYLAAQAPAITHYKCCSTFDSAIEVGNLAVGLDGLRRAGHASPALVLGGQPSLGRYCAFGQLFAAAGQGGEVVRIDRHPTMRCHPVTPMTEADLRRHLQAQGMGPMALLDWRQLEDLDGDALAAQADALGPAASALLFDALRADHLAAIGRLWWRRAQRQPQLVLGASSVAQALIAAWPDLGRGPATATPRPPRPAAPGPGPVFLLVGSRSPVTAGQVAAAGEAWARLDLPATAIAESPSALEHAAGRCAQALQRGQSVLAQMSAPAGDGTDPAPLALARAGGRLLREVLVRAPAVRRVGLAGGDTSGWALRELAPWALQWQATLAPGVPLLRACSDDPGIDGLSLMLKGGQMGPPELFERLRSAS